MVILVGVLIAPANVCASDASPGLSRPADPSAQPSDCCRFHTAGMEMDAIQFLRDFADPESARIRKRLALSPVGEPVEVYITGRLDNFGIGKKPTHTPLPWVAGVANPRLRSIALHLSHFTVDELKTTLSHELAHIYVWERAAGNRMPRWYEEGLAMWLAREPSLRHLRTVVENYPTAALPQLSEISKSFPRESLAAHRAYATSYAFLRWAIENVDKENASQRILRLVALDIPFARAFETVMGGSPEQLEARWRATLTRGIWIPLVIHLTDLLWMFCALLVVIGGWRVWGRPREPEPDEEDEFFQEVNNGLADEDLRAFVRSVPSENDDDTRSDPPRFVH